MTKIRDFKGGSLSSTSLMTDEEGKSFVRKTVSLVANREYGFQRWYSQLKRLQRYSVSFPNFFPKVLRFGKELDYAYMDIEYFENAVNAQEYIENSKNENEINSFFDSLVTLLSRLHKDKIFSNNEAMELYIYEEIEQRLKDCNENNVFTDFLQHKEIVFNGIKVTSFLQQLDEYKKISSECYVDSFETFTHGNITLENMLYVPDEKRIILIDPYEENIIDSIFAEYSQLLQSTNSKYEIYNRYEAHVNGNIITLNAPESFGIDYLNKKISKYMDNNFSRKQYFVVKLFEISQFIRMLPFKMKVDESKMIFFYGLASYLFYILKKEYKLFLEDLNE